jgi:hypothetical protein
MVCPALIAGRSTKTDTSLAGAGSNLASKHGETREQGRESPGNKWAILD